MSQIRSAYVGCKPSPADIPPGCYVEQHGRAWLILGPPDHQTTTEPTNDELLELQHRTIEAQTASMKLAGAEIVNAKVAILSLQSTVAHYERALVRAVSNLEAARAMPHRAVQLLDDTIRLIQSALDGECP